MKKLFTILLFLVIIPLTLVSCKSKELNFESKLVNYKNEVSSNDFYSTIIDEVNNHKNNHIDEDYESKSYNLDNYKKSEKRDGKKISVEEEKQYMEFIKNCDLDNELIENNQIYSRYDYYFDRYDNQESKNESSSETNSLIQKVEDTFYSFNKNLMFAEKVTNSDNLFYNDTPYNNIIKDFNQKVQEGATLYIDDNVYTAVIDNEEENNYIKKVWQVSLLDSKISYLYYYINNYKKDDDISRDLEVYRGYFCELEYKNINLKTVNTSDYKFI